MGRLSKNFIRFPRRCRIFDAGAVTPFTDGEQETVWEGRCRVESNTSIRSFTKGENVLMSDYRVQLGSVVGGSLPGDYDACYDGRHGEECGAVARGISSGMFVEVSGESYTLSVTDVYVGQLGTTVYCNVKKT